MFGIEGEGWGTTKWKERSEGGGPNVTLSYGSVGIDLTLHYRRFGEEKTPLSL